MKSSHRNRYPERGSSTVSSCQPGGALVMLTAQNWGLNHSRHPTTRADLSGPKAPHGANSTYPVPRGPKWPWKSL